MALETVGKVNKHGQVTIPADLRRAAHIEIGDYVEFRMVDDKIQMFVKKLIDKDQAYFWTKEWQEGELEADEDIKAGRVKAFDSVDELIEELNT